MTNLQLRLELQASLQDWVDGTMHQYEIPASMMEDAVNKVLVNLKEQVWTEYLLEQHALIEAENRVQAEQLNSLNSSINETEEEETDGLLD